MRSVPAIPAIQGLQRNLAPLMDGLWALLPRDEKGHLPRSLAVTAPEGRAGVTTVTTALALSMAQESAAPVLLVEASHRESSLTSRLGVEGPGLLQVLEGQATADDAAVHLEGYEKLHLMGSGTHRPAALMAALGTEAGRDALCKLEQGYALTLFDLSPVTTCAASRQVLFHTDAAILLLRHNRSLDEVARRGLEILQDSSVTPVLILNDYRPDLPRWLAHKDPAVLSI